MSNFKKLMMSSATGGEALDVSDVFSTYLYTGTGAAQTITNGIDLDGEGGLVWSKARSSASAHFLQHRTSHYLSSNTTAGETADARLVTQFNSNGYNLGIYGGVNGNGDSMASWTFRKAPKFFDVVTYTGTGSTQNISHGLGAQTGFMLVKSTSNPINWYAFHRQMGNPNSYTQPYLWLNQDYGVSSLGDFVTPVDLSNTQSFQASGNINISGYTYVAYLFAHNDGDGEFGPDGDADIIKCGSFTGGSDVEVDVGFEPQFVLAKAATTSGDWFIHDTMRKFSVFPSGQATLKPNSSSAEGTSVDAALTTNGFRTVNSSTGQTYIYVAIRRGPLSAPDDLQPTDVFHVDEGTDNTIINTGFTADAMLNGETGSNSYKWQVSSRLTDRSAYVTAGSRDYDATWLRTGAWASNTGLVEPASFANLQGLQYIWKRMPEVFDAVYYKGDTSSATHVVKHSLGVTPELLISRRLSDSENTHVYTDFTGSGYKTGVLNSNSSVYNQTYTQNRLLGVNETSFNLGTNSNINGGGDEYLAWLFASKAGISKVGKFAFSSSSFVNIECGFTNGARFVMMKRVPTGSTAWDHWFVWDSLTGITTGIDPFQKLNETTSQATDGNNIQPYSGGFAVANSGLNLANGQEIIFLAFA